MKKKNKFESTITTCPYCKTKKQGNERFCYACNLDYTDLEKTKIKDYKTFKKQKHKFGTVEGKVVNAVVVPDDVNYSSLKMFVIFLGIFGIHNFYVARTFKGVLQLIFSLLAIGLYFLYTFLLKNNVDILFFFVWVAMVPIGMWFVDMFNILRNKYKFPVVLKTPVDVNSILKAGDK